MKNSTLILFIFFCGILNGQQMGVQSLDQLRESPVGSKVIQWLDLVNSGEEITDEAIVQLFSKRLIGKYSPSDLANMLEDVRQKDGQLDLYEANRTEEFRYETTFRSRKNDDWVSGFIILEKAPPYAVDGFGLNNGDQYDGVDKPIYGPEKQMKFQPKTLASISPSEMSVKANEIAQAYHDMGWFSGVVLIADNGKKVFEKAYGQADLENNIPNSINTKIRIGSINKDYTAVLVLQQVQRGNISMDDKLSKFDLGFPKKIADKINVRQLLNHTAGFADIFIPEYLDNIRNYKNINDILPLLMNEPLAYEPGKDQHYSNYGYIVLGAILEKTTDKSFGQLLDENIHAITGCKNTDYDIAENISGEAKSYRYSVTGQKIDHTGQLEYPTPDGGMYATANDLLVFFQTLFYTEKLLADQYKVLMVNNFKEAKMNWKELLDEPQAGVGFAGGGPGVSAVVEANFHKNNFIIVLANTDRGVAEDISRRMVNAYKGRNYDAPNLPPANYLYGVYKKEGTDYLTKNYKDILKEGGFHENNSGLLNNAGYALIQENKLNEAIDLFYANTLLFPKEANPYDSLAEAYLAKGEKEKALKYYKKALEVDPDFPSAKRAVKELE